ncbi:hypothetical protein JOQ06_011925, partial [Pogonophryne albipinna]
MFRLEVLHRGGLSGVVYFHPKVGGAERKGFASIPTIHQWLTEQMKLNESLAAEDGGNNAVFLCAVLQGWSVSTSHSLFI